MDAWLVGLLVIASYGALIILLGQTKIFERLNVQVVLGFLLVWRTKRFRDALEWLAKPRRLWIAFADASLVLVFLAMAGMAFLLMWIATLVIHAPPDAIRVEQVIGIPAVNPLIPLWYGIFGLTVAILVHEGCHGILARAEGIGVRSVGLLIAVFPIGAFVEPEEREMRAAPVRKRLRIFAVGPSSNLILAVICAFMFSSVLVGSLEPISRGGVYVVGIFPDSPAAHAGLLPNTMILGIEDAQGSFALEAPSQFSAYLHNTTPHQTIFLHTVRENGTFRYEITLSEWPAQYLPPGENRTYGFVGVSSEDPSVFLLLARPLERVQDGCGSGSMSVGNGCAIAATSGYLQLPVIGFSPMPQEKEWIYRPTGAAAGLGGSFWIFADGFYWLFWLNFMVGTFNALPMLPLDGGHMYRDGVLAFLRRRKAKAPAEPEPVEEEKPTLERDDISPKESPMDDLFGKSRDPLERRAHAVAVYTSFAMLFLVLWQFIGPRVGQVLFG
jgi:membrane-associated protease RseP (regulator of RpoE activity)